MAWIEGTGGSDARSIPFTDKSSFLVDYTAPELPYSFLRGSTPHLRSLRSDNVAFAASALPKLLLSSPGLVRLSVWNIPPPGYFSAEIMFDCLSSLMGLEKLRVDLTCYLPGPRRRQSSLTCTSLPMLPHNQALGTLYAASARFEAPLLKDAHLECFDPAIVDFSKVSLFISHDSRGYIQSTRSSPHGL